MEYIKCVCVCVCVCVNLEESGVAKFAHTFSHFSHFFLAFRLCRGFAVRSSVFRTRWPYGLVNVFGCFPTPLSRD